MAEGRECRGLPRRILSPRIGCVRAAPKDRPRERLHCCRCASRIEIRPRSRLAATGRYLPASIPLAVPPPVHLCRQTDSLHLPDTPFFLSRSKPVLNATPPPAISRFVPLH